MKSKADKLQKELLKLKLWVGLTTKQFKTYLETGKLPKKYLALREVLKNEKKASS